MSARTAARHLLAALCVSMLPGCVSWQKAAYAASQAETEQHRILRIIAPTALGLPPRESSTRMIHEVLGSRP